MSSSTNNLSSLVAILPLSFAGVYSDQSSSTLQKFVQIMSSCEDRFTPRTHSDELLGVDNGFPG